MTLQQCGDDNRTLCIIRRWRDELGLTVVSMTIYFGGMLPTHVVMPLSVIWGFAQADLAHYNWRGL